MTRVKCRRCGGDGTVANPDEESAKGSVITCPRCGGRGSLAPTSKQAAEQGGVERKPPKEGD